LESIYKQKPSDLEELRKSVLQKPFNRELITDQLKTNNLQNLTGIKQPTAVPDKAQQ
jgi:hypothetical protein